MNDNLPDINFKEKKEKKKGIGGWLRSRLGMGSRGAMGEAGISPSAMNVGKAAFGAGKFGASSGIAGLLAGKAGLLAMVATVAVGAGVYLANQAPAPSMGSGSFSGGKVADNYVPAILRSQAQNQGSSLDMFKETNRSAGLAMEEDLSKKNKAKPADETPASAEEAQEQPAPQGNMAQEMMGKLQGGDIGSLTSSMGGGSNKFSGMGGFSNKFNQGQTGAKTGFTSGIGSGFQGMPKFDARKSKMTAMKASAKPVFSKGSANKKGKFGVGAFGQAKGMRSMQKSYTGNQADSMSHTQTAAWTGATAEGSSDGGSGLSDGGAGIMSSPSLDTTGGGGGGGNIDEPTVPDAPAPVDVSPWKSDISKCMSLILLSCILSFIASQLCQSKVWIIWLIGLILAIIALVMALYALSIAIKLMGSQKLLGSLYLVGAMLAVAAAVMAISGASKGPGTPAATEIMWLAAGGGIIGLMASMFSGK